MTAVVDGELARGVYIVLRAKTISDVLSKADQLRTGKESSAAGTLTALDAAAAQVDGDAKAASGLDQKRLAALADTLRRRAAGLR